MPRHLLKSLLILAACAPDPDTPSPAHASIDTLPSGTIVTTSRAPVAWRDGEGWRLTFVREIGTEDSDSLFSPHGIVVTRNGHVVVLDRSPARLLVYDSTGRRIATVGRQGAGPGEFAPGGIVMVVGDTIVHHDRNRGRVQRFLLDGTLMDSWLAPCCVGEPTRADTLGRIAIPAVTRRVAEGEVPWAGNGFIRFDGTGRALDTLVAPRRPSPGVWAATRPDGGHASVQIPLAAGWLHALTPGGEWVHGHTDALRLAITGAAGDTLRVIEAVAPEWPVADSVRQRRRDEIVAQNPALEAVARWEEVPTHWPRWSDLAVDPTGALWVLASGATGEGDHWLVFDRDGRWLGRVAAPFRKAVRMHWGIDHLHVIERDPEGGPDVVRVYRIERS